MADDPETLEGQENEEEQEETPDPVGERFTKLEAMIAEQGTYAKGVGNYVGGLGRQIENLLKQPPTVARDERVDELLGRLENVEISLMPDPEEREKAYRERLTKPREVPKEELPKGAPQDNRPPVETIVLQAEYQQVQSELADFATEIGIPPTVAWANVEPRIQTADNPNGEFRRGASPTASDPRAWRPFVKAIKEEYVKHRNQIRNQAKDRTPIDTQEGSGASKSVQTRYQAWLKGDGPKPSDAEIDSLTVSYLTRAS